MVQGFIVVSLIIVALETLPNLPPGVMTGFKILEWFLVVAFTLEYLLRLFTAEKKLSYVFSFFGLIDLLAILPFYLSLGFDLKCIRVFRLFRLFLSLKWLRYSAAANRLGQALSEIKEELIIYFLATGLLLYLASVGIYYFEYEAQPDQFQSVPHSFWWAIITVTTVGYGDVYPITLGGRIFTSVVLLLGLGVIAVPSGLIASAMTKTLKKRSGEKHPST